MFCPKCGAEAKDGAAFCEKCGAPLSPSPTDSAEAAPAGAFARVCIASKGPPGEITVRSALCRIQLPNRISI